MGSITNVTNAFSSFQAGVGSVGTTAAQLNNVTNKGVIKKVVVKNTHNTNLLYVGGANVANSDPENGYELAQDETIELEVRDATKIWVIGSGASTTYTWFAL